MQWFFCWCQDTEFREDHNWKDLIRATVHSARKYTTLEPNFIYDGAPSDFTEELAASGVKIIFHRLSFTSSIINANPENKIYQAVARGAFLRFDIPLVTDTQDEYVLYTDADMLFLEDPDFTGYHPKIIAAAPESVRGSRANMNSGVMLLNLPNFRTLRPKLVEFTCNNLHRGLDQEILRAFLGLDYLLLPDLYNWKPYWGVNREAAILHWQGPKPETIKTLLNSTARAVPADWLALFEKDRASYQHYLRVHEMLLTEYRAAQAARPPAPRNLAHGKTVTPIPRNTGAAGPYSWVVDLGDIFGITGVRISCRPGSAQPPHSAIEIGTNPNNICEIFRPENAETSAAGEPFVFTPDFPVFGRFVRIHLATPNGLEHVEIHGAPPPGFIPKSLL